MVLLPPPPRSPHAPPTARPRAHSSSGPCPTPTPRHSPPTPPPIPPQADPPLAAAHSFGYMHPGSRHDPVVRYCWPEGDYSSLQPVGPSPLLIETSLLREVAAPAPPATHPPPSANIIDHAWLGCHLTWGLARGRGNTIFSEHSPSPFLVEAGVANSPSHRLRAVFTQSRSYPTIGHSWPCVQRRKLTPPAPGSPAIS